jgi:predicted MFS family arabinose efflux permease
MTDPTQKQLEKNIDRTCLIGFVDGMWFPFPIIILFFLRSGMSMSQIGMIVGASYAVSLLLDIPSSVWADKYSRKSVLIVGSTAFMLLNIIIFLSDSFGMFFLAFCLNGVGTACWTGIFSAFVYDTLLSLGREKQYEQTQARLLKYFFGGRIIASIFGVYIYSIDPKMPFLLSALANFACVMVVFTFKEPIREKSISKSFDQVKEGLAFLLKHRMIWNTVIVFSIVVALWDVLFAYYQPVMQASGIPLAYFSIVYVFVSLSGLLGASLYQKMKSKIDWKGIMLIYLFIDLVSSVFFGTQIAALVVLSIALLTFASGSFDIYIGGIVHRIVPSSHRATTLSIRSQMYMLITLLFINVVSFTTDHGSLPMGMLLIAALGAITLIFFLAFVAKEKETVIPLTR